MIPICFTSFFGAYFFYCDKYSFLSNLLLGVFASALLVFATSLVSYLVAKKVNKENYIYEVNKIIRLYKGATYDFDNKRGDRPDPVYYRAEYYEKIKDYDLTALKNITNDYCTILPCDKTKQIINEIFQEIDSYNSNILYDVAMQVIDREFSGTPDLDRFKELLDKLN